MILIKLKEHQSDIYGLSCWLEDIPNEPNKRKYLGLYYDFWKGKKQLKTSYFIGACWIEKNQLALQVESKIKDIDYLKMFLTCFKHPKVAQELSKIYQIDFNQPKIELDTNNTFEITPLLIIHFLQVIKAIVRKGLKKSYYPIEQNLNAKIKGKINIGKTLKHNIFKGQNHKTVCHYQEFGINCAENRLLKKALKFAQSYLAKSDIQTDDKLKQTLAYCLAPFELVSNNIEIREMKSFKNNVLFKDYAVAIKLAKMILKHFAYNLQNTHSKNLTPPFWIDMSLLFEKYVYALLLTNNKVKYQAKGNYGNVDFLIDDVIIDTKYKTNYSDDKYSDKIEDIRQLSGYGRDTKIRKELDLNTEIAKCLIIYPNKNAPDLPDDLWVKAEAIPHFEKFKKIAIKLPSFDS